MELLETDGNQQSADEELKYKWHISIFSSIKVSALWLSAQPVAHRLENKGSKPSLETWA